MQIFFHNVMRYFCSFSFAHIDCIPLRWNDIKWKSDQSWKEKKNKWKKAFGLVMANRFRFFCFIGKHSNFITSLSFATFQSKTAKATTAINQQKNMKRRIFFYTCDNVVKSPANYIHQYLNSFIEIDFEKRLRKIERHWRSHNTAFVWDEKLKWNKTRRN